MEHNTKNFDIADALDFIVENPTKVTIPEMIAAMAEAASTIEELRRDFRTQRAQARYLRH